METGIAPNPTPAPETISPDRALAAQTGGVIAWWIHPEGRLGVSELPTRQPELTMASGRVCLDARIGVVERIDGRDAVLGHLSRSVVDLLCVRFPGVRWAVADPKGR